MNESKWTHDASIERLRACKKVSDMYFKEYRRPPTQKELDTEVSKMIKKNPNTPGGEKVYSKFGYVIYRSWGSSSFSIYRKPDEYGQDYRWITEPKTSYTSLDEAKKQLNIFFSQEIPNPTPRKMIDTRIIHGKRYYFLGKTQQWDVAENETSELRKQGMGVAVTKSGFNYFLWATKLVNVDLMTRYNPIKDIDRVYDIVPSRFIGGEHGISSRSIAEKLNISEIKAREALFELMDKRFVLMLNDDTYLRLNGPRYNPTKLVKTMVHPEALVALKRMRADSAAGHDAEDYWRGAAAAYFTANPSGIKKKELDDIHKWADSLEPSKRTRKIFWEKYHAVL
jgi:hypothetical protein